MSWLLEIRSADPGREGVGTRRVWVMEDRNNNNQKMEIVAVVQEWDPPKTLTLSLDAPGGFRGRQTYRLTGVGDGRTQVEIDSRYQFDNWLAKLLEPLITPSANAKMARDVAELKRMVESQTPVTSALVR